MTEYSENELKNIEIVKSLYTDVFDTGNCPVVNSYYHEGAKCHLKGKTLHIEQMKGGMGEFVAKHASILTSVESVFAAGDRTYARLNRRATLKGEEQARDIEIMVEKRFVDGKVAELWFMVDDEMYSEIWLKQPSA
ncbi:MULTISPECIES: ester cyclase [Pantoea]|uniref:ester cyclase n=1 Tax=Pantoea TaxID=53335 RepID=UPI000E262923|nr:MULTISPECIES: ester cyclase [Pantoea]MCS3402500.1 ester cyclase [Pantoea sp. B566]MCS4493683.1 ester cyclase [Pantoea sp. B623]REF11533.1 SnoaL-like polyketide cyclase [Pantoea ananatis]